MSVAATIPTWKEFLAAPVEEVGPVAPRTMVYAPGGTRRSATFSGIEPFSSAYVRSSQDKITECLEVIFHYGVEHVFTPIVMVGHVNEVEDVERQLIGPMAGFVADPHLMNLARKHGWRMKIAPSAYADMLQPFIDTLQQNTPEDAAHTWWMTIIPSHESWWSNMIELAKSDRIQNRKDAVRCLYGEDIPPITLCFAFGKPTISPDLFPPLLMGNVQCYWSQQAGYTLTDSQFRRVLYDYTYLRQTWRKDKTSRAKEAQAQQEIWVQDAILGLGRRLGPFWYPEFSSFANTEHDVTDE